MRIVIAPDKFKGSLTAAEVVQSLADGFHGIDQHRFEVVQVPVADGGEGTVEAAIGAGWTEVAVNVTGPTGQPVQAAIAVRGREAVVEMALASGLGVLPTDERGRPVLDAMGSSSVGTGEMIAAALEQGCRRIILGIGGSANTDGGSGMLSALGVALLDEAGEAVRGSGGGLAKLASVDVSKLDPRIAETEFVLASDVDNPLTGANGAAAVFGPQKGADAEQVLQLDANLANWRDRLSQAVGPTAAMAAQLPGAGAAGGVGYAALVVLKAARRPGIEVVLDLVDLDAKLEGADLVITGEGSLDEQSLGGKTPMGVAAAARRAGAPVIAVCGITSLSSEQLSGAGFAGCYALSDLEPDAETSMANASSLLHEVAKRIIAEGASPARSVADGA